MSIKYRIDEFGNNFGKDGNHFFVSALNCIEKDKFMVNLIQYYAKIKLNQLMKF